MRTRVVLSAVVLALSGFTLPAAQAAPTAGAAADVGTMAVTFAEEFNGAAGTRPDASKWNTEVGDNNGNNREHQYYTTSASNAATAAGWLPSSEATFSAHSSAWLSESVSQSFAPSSTHASARRATSKC